ncbi:TonB-dependent receptor plug domain-containing protein [Rugamonas apoptosis]|uniref:TonB-dependent receptor n=1 Tax=Rugamonas apoptosis TaxID=2758570 RepID=A0A7W2FCK7_9BURK|nr:TonB-dependent receptor [Rugamonas apoptosis]MBA5689260.1 TonB-dependent receptor [Rugamonas apoptosis]
MRPRICTKALLALAVAASWPAGPALAQAAQQEQQEQQEQRQGQPAGDAALEELLRQTLNDVPRGVEESTSSRYAQSAADAPSVTYVLTDADIARHGLRNMADILRSMPGLYVTGDGNFTFVGARGLGRPGDFNARLLFLVDGMRVNENIYDAGSLGAEFFVDVDVIDRVEYAPGPGSALYGNNAFLGVVNVITKGADKLRGVQLRAAVDSDRRREVRASWGQRVPGQWEGWLAASAFEQDRIAAPFDIAPALRDALLRRSWDRGQRLLGMASAGDWTMRAGVAQRERDFPYPLSLADASRLARQRNVFDAAFASLAWERTVAEDWNLYGVVALKHSQYRNTLPYLREDGAEREFDKVATGRWINVDLRVSTHRWRDHDLMAGAEYQSDLRQEINTGTVGEEPDAIFSGRNRRHGLFVQDAWRLGKAHRLILGLRRDQAKVGGGSTNPRLAWLWSGVPDATLKLMYGSAFREANLYEYQVNVPLDAPVPTPERVRTLELAWDHRLTPRLQYQVSLYGSQLRDLISTNQDIAVYENSAPIRNRGAELGLERRWDGGQRLRATVSLQDTRDSAGQRLDNSPRTLVKLLYSQPLRGDALQLSWQALSVSRRSAYAQDLPGYALLNATLLWRPSLGTDVSLGLYNIGNVRYYDMPTGSTIPLRQEGRVLRFSLTRRFGS